jgi:Mn2+/Fe2+ NRAMP family transporter
MIVTIVITEHVTRFSAFVLIFMLVLVNRKTLMGDMQNRGWQNVIAGSTSAVMIVLTVVMLWTSIRG